MFNDWGKAIRQSQKKITIVMDAGIVAEDKLNFIKTNTKSVWQDLLLMIQESQTA
jgi:uncharacterized lipoprotein YbaY